MGTPTGEKVKVEDIEYEVYVDAKGVKYVWRYNTFGEDTQRYPYIINNEVQIEGTQYV